MKTMIEKYTEDPQNMRLFQQRMLILECTELVCEMMEEKGITRKEIADKLGKTTGYITRILNGPDNMTLKTISDIMWAMDLTLCVAPGTLELQPKILKSGIVI